VNRLNAEGVTVYGRLKERHAIEDAIRILGILEWEEARYDAEQKRLAVGSLLEKLRSVGFNGAMVCRSIRSLRANPTNLLVFRPLC
jgi:hypothetical protein